MQPKPNIIHLPVYQPGKPIEAVKRELGLTEVIKLASNENPYGCSPVVKEAIVREMENTALYPDGGAFALSEALAAHLGVKPDQLIFGAGADEVIQMVARAYLMPGDETIMAAQTFPQYKFSAMAENAAVVEVPLKDGVHDLDAMLERITERTKIVWVCNPNNPTGTFVTRAQLVRFLDAVPPGVMVVLDEAYFEYAVDPEYPNGIALLPKYPNLVVLRTFSKIYGLASLRIGYGVAHADVIRNVNQVRQPFNTSRFAQTAAIAALGDMEFVRRCREANRKGLQFLGEAFDRMGLRHLPSQGNFIFVDVQRDAKDVFERLLRRGIIVRAGFPGFPTGVRITVGTPEQNEKLIAALEAVLHEAKVQV